MGNATYDDIIPILREKWNTKDDFIEWTNKNLKIKIPKNSTYEKTLSEIHNLKKENVFCKKAFSCNSLKEIIEKYDIELALGVFSREELTLIADILSVHKQKWKYNKTTIRGLTKSIVINTTKEDLQKLFENLILEHRIPDLIQYYKIVAGPLGITKAIVERRGVEADDLIDLLSKYLTMSTYDEFKKRAKFIPSDYKTGTANQLLPIKLQQIIISTGTKKQILDIFNELIADEVIKINKDYDYYAFKVTPCGIFSNIPDDPIEKLVDILMDELPDEALDNELRTDGYTSGPIRSRLVGMTIITPPESILEKIFGLPDLREIGKNLGLVRIDKISNKTELIRYLLIRIGFSMPKRIEGISQFIKILEGYGNQVKNNTPPEKLTGIMTSVYIETEKILKDLIYFHTSCFWPESTESGNREKILDLVHKKIKKEFDEGRDIPRLTFGQLIHLMKKMNKYVDEKNNIKKIVQDELDRSELFPSTDLDILLQINDNRARFTHNSEISQQNENIFTPSEIIEKLLKIAKDFQIKKTYPTIFRVLREITNEYNVSYLEATDENGNSWTVKTNDWIEPGTIGFMHSKTDVIAVFPLITTKFW